MAGLDVSWTPPCKTRRRDPAKAVIRATALSSAETDREMTVIMEPMLMLLSGATLLALASMVRRFVP